MSSIFLFPLLRFSGWVSRHWRAWFHRASFGRTLAEIVVLAVGITLIVRLVYGENFESLYALTLMFFVNPLCGLYYGLRLRPLGRSKKSQVFWETLSLFALSMLLNLPGWWNLLTPEGNMQFASETPEMLLLVGAVMAFPYLFFRVFARLAIWWAGKRERRLVWSLMNSHLLAVALLQMMVLIPILLLFLASSGGNWTNFTLGDNTLAQGFYRLNMSLPLIGLLILLCIAIMVPLLPVSALVSYLLSQRIKQRLDTLLTAAHAARDGDYHSRVIVSGSDEITTLQTDFNIMIASLGAHVSALNSEREKVAELLALRHDLMANVSHELRTPLATLRAAFEAAERRSAHSNSAQLDANDLRIVNSQLESLQSLIDDLFAFARAETDHLALNIGPTDLPALLARLVESSAPLAWRDKRIEISAQIPPWLPPVAADVRRLEQALLNLIHNSLRHTLPGGVVMLSARQQGAEVEIQVRDTGDGIDPADLPHLWDRFYRGSNPGGSGLGLALVKAFVEAMGGRVGVESTLGEGACFSITLPLSDAPSDGAHLPQPVPVPYRAGKQVET